MLNTIILFANTATQTADGSTPKGGFGWTNILLLVGIVVIFYFFMKIVMKIVRSNRKR